MKPCVEWEGLIAQSLYEALEVKEQEALNSHLSSCEACRSEFSSLQQFTETISDEPIEFTGDLRRSLEEEIRTMEPVKPVGTSWITPFKALAAVMILTLGFVGYSQLFSNRSESQTATLLNKTSDLVSHQQYWRAYMLLNDHLSNPTLAEHLETAKVQGVLAELTFSRLRMYPEAYEAFDTLRKEHPTTFAQSDDYQRTFQILEEARLINSEYDSLHEWDRLNRDVTIASLEAYIVKYPGTHQATEAVHNIARCMIQYADVDYLEMNKALELAVSDEENPHVAMQIKLVLGEYYLNEDFNPNKAKRMLGEVVSGPIPVLSDKATVMLASLPE